VKNNLFERKLMYHLVVILEGYVIVFVHQT